MCIRRGTLPGPFIVRLSGSRQAIRKVSEAPKIVIRRCAHFHGPWELSRIVHHVSVNAGDTAKYINRANGRATRGISDRGRRFQACQWYDWQFDPMSILTDGITPGYPALHLEYCGKPAICLYRAPGRGRPSPSGVSIYRLRASPATEMHGGFWHRPPTILIRNGLLETVADQHHQNLRGKGNAVIRSPTRHHIERASDVLPSVQPRCFALQRPLMKRGWRCYAVQDRYVEKGAREKGRGADISAC